MYVTLDNDGFVAGMGETAGDAAQDAGQWGDYSEAYWLGRAVAASAQLVARVRRDGAILAHVVDGVALPYGVDVDAPGAVALCEPCGGCGLVLDCDNLQLAAIVCAPCAGSGVAK